MSPKVCAIIPARKGSKRLPNKNKKLFCGKPLICWSIEVALECSFIDEIIVSTDDLDIINICQERYELDFKIKILLRPDSLAQDDTPMDKVVLHAINKTCQGLKINDIDIILLQPTSPLRDSTDILIAFNSYRVTKPLPLITGYWKKGNYNIILNGAIYITQGDRLYYDQGFIINTNVIWLMPKESSIDIDTLEEFEKAEKIMKKRLEDK